MQTTRSVFIVDDSSDIRESLTALVSHLGINAESFSSGSEFLSAYDATMAGCLIIDVCLPGMSGLEVLDVLAERGARLPAIVVTAYGEVSMVVRAVRAGAIDFLEKPCVWDELKGSIDLALKLDALSRKVAQQLSAIDERLALLTPQERRVMEMLIEGKPNKEVLESLSDMIMGRVAALLPESYQGVYKTGRSSGYTASDTPDRH